MENMNILQSIPGFRFHPTDEELVVHYLQPKIQSTRLPYPIPVADVSRSDPWSLPGDSHEERYFFSTLETKYPNGKQTIRITPSGHWKQTGSEQQVVDSRNQHVGSKKTLVFYRLKPRSKTDWIMHEFKVANPDHGVENWVVCRVFLKKKAKKDDGEDVQVVEVGNTGAVYYVPDLNLDGDGSSSPGSSGVTVEDEVEMDSN